MIINLLLKIRLLCLFAIIFLFANEVDANTDSLKQIWTNVAQPDSIRFKAINVYYTKNLFAQPDSAILLTAYHIELANQKHLKKEKAIALGKKAIALSVKGDYDNALIEMNKVVDIYSNINDSIGLAKTYNNLAIIYTKRIEYQKALKYYSKCLTYYQTNKIEDAQVSVLINIGRIHLTINNYDLALDFFNKALHLYKKSGITNKGGLIWHNIGRVNLGKKNYSQAIKDSQKALKVFQSLKQQYYIANAYTLNARIYQALNQVDTALFYLQKGLKLHQIIGNNLLVLEDQVILAHLIFPTDVNKATKIGEEVLRTAGVYHNHSMKIELYDLLYKCYKKQKNYPLSIAMLEKHNTYSDSLSIEQDQIAVTQKAIQNEYETKILNTQLKNEQAQAQLKRNQVKKTYTILFLALSIILCLIFYYRAKKVILRKQQEALLHKVNHLNELEKTRHQLIHSEKMAALGQLTAGVAHEINDPVNFISSGVIGLKKTLNVYIKGPKDEAAGELVEDMNDMINAIEVGAKRTSNMVRSLRRFSRDDTVNYVEVDVITGLESTFRLLSNKLKQGGFIEKYFEKKKMPIFCFPGQLNQVFMNILLNAIQAVAEEGTIKIGVVEHGKNIVISISDTGPGIPDDKKQKIFEPFYTTKGVQGGTGLGLSIASDIIKKHKGSIEVKDNDPKGTKFIISLPKRAELLIN